MAQLGRLYKNGIPLDHIDVELFVEKGQHNKDMKELSDKVNSHVNSSSAHDEHINYLIDQKLKEQQNVLTNNNQSNRAWHTSIWAIIGTLLGVIVSGISLFLK